MKDQALSRPTLRIETHHAVVSLPKSPARVDASRMVRDLSGLMAILVLFMHSRAQSIPGMADRPSLVALQSFLQNPGFYVRVPLFFVFSGWLFWRNAPSTRGEYARKIARRARTVLGPYLIWGAYSILVGLVSARMNGYALPSVSRSSEGLILGPSYYLWFLRHLFTMFLLSPALGALLANRRVGVATLVGFAAWHVFGSEPDVLGIFLAPRDLFYFALGGYAAIHGVEVPRVPRRLAPFVTSAYLMAVVATFALDLRSPGLARPFYDAEGLAGTLLILATYRPEWAIFRNPLVRAAGRTSFFIYVAQEPMLSQVRKHLLALTGLDTAGVALQFFLAPLLTATILATVATALDRRLPRLYAFLTGGRGRRPEPVPAARPTLTVVQGGLADAPREQARVAA